MEHFDPFCPQSISKAINYIADSVDKNKYNIEDLEFLHSYTKGLDTLKSIIYEISPEGKLSTMDKIQIIQRLQKSGINLADLTKLPI